MTIRYTVRDGQPGVPEAATYEKARPVIERDWLYLHGEGVFAVPEGRETAPASFRLRGPRGWRVVSDLEGATRLTANEVGGGIVIGGKALRLIERQVDGERLRVALLGRWSFDDALFADRIAQVMASENAMLGASGTAFFVPIVPLAQADTGGYSYGGSGRTAGFALASTGNVEIGEMTRLLAHEYGHRWFGRGFGPQPAGAGPYWFTEGATDWFADRAMVRAGLWSTADWARSLNGVLRRYGTSTARALSDAQITERFWTDQDAMQVQYDRGNLTALVLDRILDGGAMPVLAALARTPDPTDEVAGFVRLVDAASPRALATARSAANDGLAPDLLAACGTIAWIERRAYDRGFAFGDDRIVTAVTTSAAREAGIAPGMRFVRRVSSEPGDLTIPYVAVFADAVGERILRWQPEGSATVRFQQLGSMTVATPACAMLVAGTQPPP